MGEEIWPQKGTGSAKKLLRQTLTQSRKVEEGRNLANSAPFIVPIIAISFAVQNLRCEKALLIPSRRRRLPTAAISLPVLLATSASGIFPSRASSAGLQ